MTTRARAIHLNLIKDRIKALSIHLWNRLSKIQLSSSSHHPLLYFISMHHQLHINLKRTWTIYWSQIVFKLFLHFQPPWKSTTLSFIQELLWGWCVMIECICYAVLSVISIWDPQMRSGRCSWGWDLIELASLPRSPSFSYTSTLHSTLPHCHAIHFVFLQEFACLSIGDEKPHRFNRSNQLCSFYIITGQCAQ